MNKEENIMSVLSVQTKKIPELQATTGLVGSDMVIVELADGGTRKMTYSNLIAVIQASLKGDEDAMMTIASISSIQTDEAGKVPSSALIKGMNDDFAIMKREIMAPYGYFGIEQNLDTLMGYVRAGQWDKFAVGDYFIDTRTNGQKVMWEIADKNGYLYCGDQNNGLVDPHIICIPRDCLNDTIQFNSTNTNTGGYTASLMPAYLETVLNTFSTKLKGYITETRILENNKGAWAWVSRKITLPSTLEVFGHAGWADAYSGGPVCHSLALFTGGNAHVLKGRGFNKSEAQRQWWWLRDPSGSSTANFCGVGNGGDSDDSNASSSTGVAPRIVLT
jgi:hypothetical protein